MSVIHATTDNNEAVFTHLADARKHNTQAAIARHFGIGVRTIRRWEARQSQPPAYLVPALQQLLPFGAENREEGNFDFIDLFAGIGGIRKAFENIGGRCVYTSEWDSYAQKTYIENFRDGHPIHGDITQIEAAQIPDHDVLLAGFPCQPFSIAGVSKENALRKAHVFDCEAQGKPAQAKDRGHENHGSGTGGRSSGDDVLAQVMPQYCLVRYFFHPHRVNTLAWPNHKLIYEFAQ